MLTITPGLDTVLVLRTAAAGGLRPAGYASIGIALGCLAWGFAVSVGLGALLAASNLAFSILKWSGAAYLIWTGGKLIARPRERIALDTDTDVQAKGFHTFKQGFLTNLLNPKVGVFYITFLPQFIPPGADVTMFSIVLTVIHVGLGLIWFTFLIATAVPLGKFLRRREVVRVLDRVAGAVFIGFGAKLAPSRA